MSSAAPPLAKLTRPRLEGAVERARLFAALDECFRAPVVWIIGPPGAGKTTLASTYLAARKGRHLWIQTDSADSDPASFFYYLRSACESAGVARKALPPLLTREYLGDVPGFARRTFRALFAHFRSGLTLALDNYQEVAAESALHRALAEACEEIPEGSRLLALSRVHPPPEYARLTASERLTRLEWEALKLTREEAHDFARARAALTEEAIESLYQSCGGWAAGFTLLRERLGRTGLVNHIDASEGLQTVFDYFAAEALRDTSPENREILVQTALLPRFTAAMAIAVSGKTGAPQLLQWLHQRHLFTDRRASGKEVFYQYHALFQSFLKSQARARLDTEAFAALARRSAQVLADNGLQEDAIELLIEAGERDEASSALLALAPTMVATGRGQAFLKWAGELPDTANPWLDYWRAQALIGPSLTEARAAFERAYAGFETTQDRTGLALAVVGVLETYFHELGDMRRTSAWIDKLPMLFEPEPEFPNPDMAALAYQALVPILYYIRPDVDLLDTCAERLERLLDQPLSPNVRVLSGAYLVDYQERLYLARASRVFERTRRAIDEPGVTPLARVIWSVRSGWHQFKVCEFEAVIADMRLARDIATHNGFNYLLTWIEGFFADVAAYRGDEEGLRAALDAQRRLLPSGGKQAQGRYHSGCSKLHTLRGESDEAVRHIREACRLAGEDAFTLPMWAYGLLLATILIERGELHEAGAAIADVKDLYPRARFPRPYWRANVLRMIIARACGDRYSWRDELQKTLVEAQSIGAPSLYVFNPLFVQMACELALEANIEIEFVRTVIRNTRLPPRRPDIPGWPWPVRIRTLGAFAIHLDDQPLTFDRKAPRKPLELLQAIVALGGANVSTEVVCHTLWPDAEADNAEASLRVALARLRKLLGDAGVVQVREGKLSLDKRRCYVDVWAFDALLGEIESTVRGNGKGGEAAVLAPLGERLLALYGGAFLRDEREQHWMLPLREQLKSRFVRAAAQLGERLEAQGAASEALALYERALAQEPTAERIYRRVMLIQLGEGRTSEAMTTYRRCRDMLSIVLGTRPDAETESLHRRAQAG